jgi:outer membrane biosynthesis protein TonB
MGDEDRDAILGRRQRFIAVALGGLSAAASPACSDAPEPAPVTRQAPPDQQPAPPEVEPPPAVADDASDGGPADAEAQAGLVALLGNFDGGMGSWRSPFGDSPGIGPGQPRPCLSVTPQVCLGLTPRPDPHVQIPVEVTLTGAEGAFDGEVLRRVVRRRLGTVRRCYREALGRVPDLEGRLVATFVIRPDGRVSGARVVEDTVGDAELKTCAERVLARLRFPEPPDSEVDVRLPLTFRRGG